MCSSDLERLEAKIGISKELVAASESGTSEPVAFRRFRTTGDEADWIAGEIAASIAAGRGARDHAVLVRANVDAAEIVQSLNLAEVPWRARGAAGLYDRPEVRLLLAGLRFAADPSSSAPLFLIAGDPRFGVPPTLLANAVGAARREHRPLRDALASLGSGHQATATLVARLDALVDESTQRTSGEVLYR